MILHFPYAHVINLNETKKKSFNRHDFFGQITNENERYQNNK